jgi:amino acid transporter
MAFIIPLSVAMSCFGGVNGILLTSSRLFYAGAMQGQMPRILSMVQVDKSTPAPAVIIVVRVVLLTTSVGHGWIVMPQALLSLIYLTSSNILMLIEFTGFATWVSD